MAVMPTSFFDLPVDCIKLIFDRVDKKELKAVSLICQDFYHLANERVQELNLSYKVVPSLHSFTRLLRRFTNLKRLSLYCLPAAEFNLDATLDLIADSGLNLEFLSLPGRPEWTDPFPMEPLIRISSNMPNLKSLNCGNLVSDDDDLTALAEIFADLEDLDMCYCGPYVTEEGFENALKRFRNLRRIEKGFNDQLSDAWLISLSIHCPLLEEVVCISGGRISLISEIGVCALVRGCSKLSRMVFGEVHWNEYHFPIAQAVCEAKNLRYLEIDYVMMVDKDCEDEGVVENGDETSATQIKETFLSAWKKVYGESY